jgi:hypothetical protein
MAFKWALRSSSFSAFIGVFNALNGPCVKFMTAPTCAGGLMGVLPVTPIMVSRRSAAPVAAGEFCSSGAMVAAAALL